MKVAFLVVCLVVGSLLAVAVALVAIGSFVLRYVLRTSGWAALAARYGVGQQPEGQASRRQTLQVGGALFRNCATVCVSREGLYVSVGLRLPQCVLSFLPEFPPMLIPWEEFRGAEKPRFYLRPALRLTIGEPPVGTLTLPAELLEAILPFLDPDLRHSS